MMFCPCTFEQFAFCPGTSEVSIFVCNIKMCMCVYIYINKYNYYLIFLVRLLYGLCAACCPPSTLTVEGCSDDNEKQVLIEEFSKSAWIKGKK